ncbi:hypothetical protein [Psychrobacter sp. Marseille-P5312]|uniref:hypothetical protein n=1 Tax=Psychrobacter sp. Marseille-P5312 TaxID=2086574 RepID=UPI001D0D439D|nr:hypothetical protein [Psychrobacter sp. Marseille-P5312]
MTTLAPTLTSFLRAIPSSAMSQQARRLYLLLPAAVLSLQLAACQETPAPTDDTQTEIRTQPVATTNTDIDRAGSDKAQTAHTQIAPATATDHDVNLTELESDLDDAAPAASDTPDTPPTPNPEQAIKGAQITDVRYISAAGESLSVTFETSAAGVLNAIVTLPNQPKMTLSAPEGQGNNPTYRSADGSIQLVSHAGGGTIDLIQNNKVKSFDAVSAEAEVITE